MGAVEGDAPDASPVYKRSRSQDVAVDTGSDLNIGAEAYAAILVEFTAAAAAPGAAGLTWEQWLAPTDLIESGIDFDNDAEDAVVEDVVADADVDSDADVVAADADVDSDAEVVASVAEVVAAVAKVAADAEVDSGTGFDNDADVKASVAAAAGAVEVEGVVAIASAVAGAAEADVVLVMDKGGITLPAATRVQDEDEDEYEDMVVICFGGGGEVGRLQYEIAVLTNTVCCLNDELRDMEGQDVVLWDDLDALCAQIADFKKQRCDLRAQLSTLVGVRRCDVDLSCAAEYETCVPAVHTF